MITSSPLARRPLPAHRGAAGLLVVLVLTACAAPRPAPTVAPTTFDERFGRGVDALRQGNFGQAAAEFEMALQLRPDSAKAHNYLGMAYERLENPARAREHFERAVELDPSFAAAFNNLGSLHALAGDHARAVELFTKAVSLSPTLAAANFNLGTSLLALGRNDEALGYLLTALRLDPALLESRSSLVIRTPSPTLSEAETAFLYAKLFAAVGNAEKTAEYLRRAREAGFRDWQRVATEAEFASVRGDPRVAAFLPR